MELCSKDLRLIAELASEAGYEASFAPVARGWFEAALGSYGPRAGELAVSRMIEAAAGVSIRTPVREKA